MEDFGFIFTRNVINERTNIYWNECYNCIRKHYSNKIIIICDNSKKQFVKKINNKLHNVKIIESEFNKRGEFLCYYYLYKYKFFKKTLIIHDSTFIQKKINIKNVNKIKFLYTHQHIKNFDYLTSILLQLKNNNQLIELLPNLNNWYNCFGIQSIIDLNFLEYIYEKYNFDIFIDYIKSRKERIHFERVFGLICSNEFKINNINICEITLYNNIFDYQPKAFHYRLHNYYEDKNKYDLDLIKIWTGR